MKPIKLKKITDENNNLGWDTIEIIDKEIASTYEDILQLGEHRFPRTNYEYRFIVIADGELHRIDEDEWESFYCYEIVD